MLLGTQKNISENVNVLVDWLAFTIFALDTPYAVIDFLGYQGSDFTELARGGMGYKNVLKCGGQNISVYYNGNDDMGIHVVCSGSSVADLIEHYKISLLSNTPFGTAFKTSDFDNTALIEFLTQLRKIGQISRIDLAVDDLLGKFFSTFDVVNIIDSNRCLSKFRTRRYEDEALISSGKKTGHTIYFGKRSSDVFMRVYDKKLEQNKKLASRDEPLIENNWVRWELELKNERANRICDILIEGKNIGLIVASVLNNYFRVIELDDNNRSRCSISAKWQEFLDTVSVIGLYVKSEQRTLKDKRTWLIKQVLPTLVGVILVDGGSLDIIMDNMETSINRMSNNMLDILQEHNPNWLDFVLI